MGKTRLTPQDWAAAALAAVETGGLGAVRIEALAPGLGASKGSFYWHFADRAALVDAALALWEARDDDTFLHALEGDGEPVDRLRALFGLLAEDHAGEVDAALSADADDPQVAAALERVSRRRVSTLETTFADLGFGRVEARRRALCAYGAFLGLATIRRQVPGLLPANGRGQRAFVDAQVRLLVDA